MSKKLNHSLAIGFFLIGLFSANFSHAQTNVYWTTGTGLGGTGSWVSNSLTWSTNPAGTTPLLNSTNMGGNIIYNFSGTNGIVTQSSAANYTVAGINWLTGGYTWNMTGSRTFTGTDATASGTNTVYITNNANLLITGANGNGVQFDALSMTGGSGATVTLSNAVNDTFKVVFGSTSAKGGRTNSVNTIIAGAGTVSLGSEAATSGFTQAGNITNNNSGGMFVLTNSASGTVAVSGAISGNGAMTLGNSGSGKINVLGAITGNGAMTVLNTTSGIINISGAISKSGPMVFTNTSTNSSSTSGNIIVSGAISGGAPITLGVSGEGNILMSNAISGNSALTLSLTGTTNSGKINLMAANSYNGGTTIQQGSVGSVGVGDSASFGSGTVTIAGAGTNWVVAQNNNLNIANATVINSGSIYRLSSLNTGWQQTNSGLITGGGSILFSQADSQTLSNTNNTFGGGVNIGSSTKVYVNSIGTSGTNSSLGTNGTITFSSRTGSSSAAELYWMGNTNETSDKAFALTAVSSSTSSGMKIYAGGSGTGGTNVTLTLNGNILSTAATNNTITLGAFNTNTLVMNGTINQAAGYTNSLVVGNSGVGTVVLSNANSSFGGGLTINAGSSSTNTVQVANIGNAGANSALGTNGTINIGGSSGSGVNILKYVGTGETNNKAINLAGTAGGATLDQSGTGNLSFSSAMTATGVGAKTITLQGSTAGTGELGAAISDFGGNVISLSKIGTGTWTLSGVNTYTGLTSIGAGGSGSSGILKIALTNGLAKGVLIGASGSANTGVLDLMAGGDYVMNSYGNSGKAAGNMAFTNSSGTDTMLTFTNANNYITTGSDGGKILNNAAANLTVAFTGAVDIGSSAANDVTFTGPGSFTLNGALISTGSGLRALTKSGAGTLTLAGAGNNYKGATAVNGGTLLLTNSATLTESTALTVSTSGYTDSSSSGRTVNATLNLASGSTLLSGSTTTVYSGGNLIVNGTAGAVVVQTNGLVGGSGTVGSINLQRGAFLTPGNSPGTLNATSASLLAGSTYNWEIKNAAGGPSAAGTNWDLLNVTNELNLSSLTTSNKLNLVLSSLDSVTGLLTTSLSGFTIDTAYSWVFAQAGSINNANFTLDADVTDYFNIDTTAFNGGAQLASYFKVEVGETTVGGSTLKTLQLMTIPEPSTGSMFGLGLAGLVVTRLLRRKNS